MQNKFIWVQNKFRNDVFTENDRFTYEKDLRAEDFYFGHARFKNYWENFNILLTQIHL